jgi:hypothetical protein
MPGDNPQNNANKETIMRHKKKHGAPVPPGNQSQTSPPDATAPNDAEARQTSNSGSPFQDQDAKRRLGGYETAGEHAIQQPTPLNDGQ